VPGIRISASLKSRLPADEREGLDEFLWAKSAGRCFLCEGEMNRAAETLEADHDDPEHEGGATSRGNLNLAHAPCNRFKRNAPSIDVRPFLRLRTFIEHQGRLVQYGDCLSHFGIEPKPSHLELNDGGATIQFANGESVSGAVFGEKNSRGEFRYTFAEVPRGSIFNDIKCQPRPVKLDQLWKIFTDLHTNPLHEPPSCRWLPSSEGSGELWMFDGQHKTLATWLMSRESVVAKVYLDIGEQATIELVNSIQSKIPKLPLSTFELAAKMEHEIRGKFETYHAEKESDASEAGFIDWLPQPERDRGRAGLRLALVTAVIDADELSFLHNVQRSGAARGSGVMTETAFKGKLLDPLLHRAPLREPLDQAELLRTRERNNVVRVLNTIDALVFVESDTDTDSERERRRRMAYQSAMAYVAALVRRTYGFVFATDEGRELLEKEPEESDWDRIQAALTRLVEHPIWTADPDLSPKVRAVMEALAKNQEAAERFRQVGLTAGYLAGVDKLPNDWWK
jgi:hypothetical protein